MSQAGVFTITELRRIGAVTTGSQAVGGGEVFEWTADRTPQDPVRGGARAIPVAPWAFGGALRTVRTDYPGAKTPSEQVLGPSHNSFTLIGRWDDRYNFPGYAVREMRRFEAMCRRGNLCRIQFQAQAFEVLITEWEFRYRREWDIEYQFTVSVHDRPDEYDLSDRSPETARSATQAYDDLKLIVGALAEATREAPRNALATDDDQNVLEKLAEVSNNLQNIGESLDARELGKVSQTVSVFKRVATQMRSMAGSASEVVDVLAEVRSDVELGVRTAMSVLDFESWSRSIRYQGRILMGNAHKGAQEMEEREEPEAIRIYRPHEGESLYSISRRFYGTPHAWRYIAERNGLTDFVLTGDEVLIIPERGEAG